MKKYPTVHLLLGSNIGDRAANLARARELLDRQAGELARVSGIYLTEPWGNPDQEEFYNQVIALRTPLTARKLLDAILEIEKDMGRSRDELWGPRVIDIDILLYEDQVIEEPGLRIPHPRLPERNFALVPLMEIAGETEHPVLKETIEALYWACPDGLEVRLLEH